MPSLPVKSSKVDSLPSDLRAIADKLINKKLGIAEPKPVPEIVERPSPLRHKYRVIPVGLSERYTRGLSIGLDPYTSSRTTALPQPTRPPQYFEFYAEPNEDPRHMAYQLDKAEKQIEMQTGYRVRLEREVNIYEAEEPLYRGVK